MKKFLVVLCVLAMVLSQGVCAFAFSEDEPNDSKEQAKDLSTYDRYEDEISVYGVVTPDDKVDWFKIKPNVSGLRDIKLDVPDGVDYDLFLMDDSGLKVIASSTKGTGVRHGIYDYYMQNRDTYYIKITYCSGEYPIEPYTLKIYKLFD